MGERSVRVDIRSDVLRRVLVGRMGEFPGLSADDCSAPDVVLSTTADCTPDDCAKLVESGAEVVILAIVPSREQRLAYESTGTRYVPMSGNSAELSELFSTLQPAG
jgi:hypothetical protein